MYVYQVDLETAVTKIKREAQTNYTCKISSVRVQMCSIQCSHLEIETETYTLMPYDLINPVLYYYQYNSL